MSAGAMSMPVRVTAAGEALRPGAAGESGQSRPLPPVTIHNVQEMQPQEDGGWRVCRVPPELWPRLNKNAQSQAFTAAGVELRFNMPADGEARVKMRFKETRRPTARGMPAIAEIHRGDFYAEAAAIGPDWTEVVIPPPLNAPAFARAKALQPFTFSPELIRVHLPYRPEVHLLELSGDVSPARDDQVPARRYLAYGSSITNGAFATRPGDLYPARVARALGVDHFNLGFAGGAYMEAEMGAWIASRSDWDFASLEMGINLIGTLDGPAFEERIAGFLPRIVDAHPDKWIFCIDMFTARGDFLDDARYEVFRRVIRDAVRRIGSRKVVHIDGRSLLTRYSGLSLDLVHPSSDGFAEIADHLAGVMRPCLASSGIV